MEQNPYAPPQADISGADSRDVELRKTHVAHEASVRSAGFLYYFSGVALILFSAILAFVPPEESGGPDAAETLVAAFVVLVIGALIIYVGTGLRGLKPWIRIPVGIISGLGLLNFPIGTLINGYILYLVFSGKGRTVLSPDYAAIVERTPEIRYRTSIIVWIFLGLLVILVLTPFVLLLVQNLMG